MKKHLLVAASALVVGLSFHSTAFANDDEQNGPSAVALSFQDGEVDDNTAYGTLGDAKAAHIGGTGLFNVNVNAGANSQLQGQNTLGAILNCSCSSGEEGGSPTALALSDQDGSVESNYASGAFATTPNSDWYENNSSTPVAAKASLDGVTGTGMFNINVNAGANSLLQGQNTVAAIIGKK